MAPEVSPVDGPEAYLLAAATGCDVRGRFLDEIDKDIRELVLAHLPRMGFKQAFLTRWRQDAASKPGCLVARYLQEGFSEHILRAPFTE
jgi:hypothetical protein